MIKVTKGLIYCLVTIIVICISKPISYIVENALIILRISHAYSFKKLFIRAGLIRRNPEMLKGYLDTWKYKLEIKECIGKKKCLVSELEFSHPVSTTHRHFLDTVRNMRVKGDAKSPIHVKGNIVIDGNHRLAAARKAGLMYITAIFYN